MSKSNTSDLRGARKVEQEREGGERDREGEEREREREGEAVVVRLSRTCKGTGDDTDLMRSGSDLK